MGVLSLRSLVKDRTASLLIIALKKRVKMRLSATLMAVSSATRRCTTASVSATKEATVMKAVQK